MNELLYDDKDGQAQRFDNGWTNGSAIAKEMVKLYSYVVKNDTGFAPNPFWGFCTVACCKPKVRLAASVEDWVIGTGSRRNVGNDKLIYAMKVTEKLSFDDYYDDPRFRRKIPTRGLIEERGDNLYYKGRLGEGIDRSYHYTADQTRHDLGGKYVLISDYFYYFGRNAVPLPDHALVKEGPGHRSKFSAETIDGFASWIRDTYVQGVSGLPFVFSYSTER
jgi:hypothetical protein